MPPHCQARATAATAWRAGKPGSEVGNGDLDLDAWLDGDRSDALHDVRGGVQVDEALVDAHLPAVERVRALPVGRLPHDEPQDLGRQAHGPGHVQLLLTGARDQVSANLFQRLYVAAR